MENGDTFAHVHDWANQELEEMNDTACKDLVLTISMWKAVYVIAEMDAIQGIYLNQLASL